MRTRRRRGSVDTSMGSSASASSPSSDVEDARYGVTRVRRRKCPGAAALPGGARTTPCRIPGVRKPLVCARQLRQMKRAGRNMAASSVNNLPPPLDLLLLPRPPSSPLSTPQTLSCPRHVHERLKSRSNSRELRPCIDTSRAGWGKQANLKQATQVIQ